MPIRLEYAALQAFHGELQAGAALSPAWMVEYLAELHDWPEPDELAFFATNTAP